MFSSAQAVARLRYEAHAAGLWRIGAALPAPGRMSSTATWCHPRPCVSAVHRRGRQCRRRRTSSCAECADHNKHQERAVSQQQPAGQQLALNEVQEQHCMCDGLAFGPLTIRQCGLAGIHSSSGLVAASPCALERRHHARPCWQVSARQQSQLGFALGYAKPQVAYHRFGHTNLMSRPKRCRPMSTPDSCRVTNRDVGGQRSIAASLAHCRSAFRPAAKHHLAESLTAWIAAPQGDQGNIGVWI